jgi:hypothetical protein
MSETMLRQQLATCAVRVWERGWVANHDGNLSQRLERGRSPGRPERFLCTPTGLSKGALKPELMLVVDETGKVLSGDLRPFSELPLHLGIHAGDVIREENNVYGGAVNIAARICALSAPGEILVSATIRDLARTSAGVTFADRDEHELKGIDDAVRLYEVRWRHLES